MTDNDLSQKMTYPTENDLFYKMTAYLRLPQNDFLSFKKNLS